MGSAFVGFCDTDYRSKISTWGEFCCILSKFCTKFLNKPEVFKIPGNSWPRNETAPIPGHSRSGIPDGLDRQHKIAIVCELVRDPQVWKLNKNGWTGHGMVYFSNASFPLAWTLRIYVWLVCSAKFPAKNNSGQFCKRTVQFLYENYVFCFFQIHVVWMLCLKQNAS